MRVTERLLRWYRDNRRALPWRGRSDPYEIWISEVMLQQTRAGTVERYYERFLERFPDLSTLAAADEEEVLALWSGLGYYRRARQLHAAARRVAAAGGELPADREALEALPGIGSYTAAAISSLAFGAAEAVVDGNVERVLSRYLALPEPPRSAAGRRAIEALAERWLDRDRPGEFNQALMELGALVCTPTSPDCSLCPLASGCEGRRSGSPESFPVPRPRRAARRERWLVVVVRDGERLLMARRPDDASLLAGLWELPWVETDGLPPERRLARRYGGRWRIEAAAARVRHSITHRALELDVHRGEWQPDGVGEASALRWIGEGEVTGLPTSSLVEKVLAALPNEAG